MRTCLRNVSYAPAQHLVRARAAPRTGLRNVSYTPAQHLVRATRHVDGGPTVAVGPPSGRTDAPSEDD
ncbi:hypothetical protein [Streptomyces sp. NPDC012508]|uniref:hypothetical protein n=1 Tax=Streptomyces sp. NPDC012508 TaxID=3364837 RepID=UPI0036C55802